MTTNTHTDDHVTIYRGVSPDPDVEMLDGGSSWRLSFDDGIREALDVRSAGEVPIVLVGSARRDDLRNGSDSFVSVDPNLVEILGPLPLHTLTYATT